MERTKPEFSPEMAREIDELGKAALKAQAGLRTLEELEMGWVAGGDGVPVWPY
jgi:hypothetical protein